MPYGTVYVFNLYSAQILSLTVNGYVFKTPIGGPVKSNTAESPYTPFSVAVPRTNLTVNQLNSPEFVTGVNNIEIHYQGDNGNLQIELPKPPALPLQSDLWLYLGYKTARLYETTGLVLPNPNKPSTTPAALSVAALDYPIVMVASK